jgi:hypothetical protein
VFVGGVAVGGGITFANNLSNGNCIIGRTNESSSLFFNGYIDDLRITKGIARYTSNFTPPTAELPANITDDPSYNSVSLLLRNGTLSGTLVPFDESPTPKAITATGGASASTVESRFGGSSIFFNGTVDSLTFADPALGTGNFTIELWIKSNSSVQYAQIIGNETSSASSGYTLLINNNSAAGGQLALYRAGALVLSSAAGDWTDNNWHHIALVRFGNSFTFYTDGSANGTGTNSGSMDGTATAYIGRNNEIPPRNLVGYIDDLRITKGVARYTKNFLPPPAQLPAI